MSALPTSSGIAGFNQEYVTNTPQFQLGLTALSNGTSYTYVQAGGALAAGATFGLTAGYVTTTGSAYSNDSGAAITSGQYFWAKKVTSVF